MSPRCSRSIASIALVGIAAASVGADSATPLLIPHSAMTGESYRSLDQYARRFYIVGLLDGLLGSPLFGANQGLAGEFHRCLLQFHSEQDMAIIDKWVTDHPTEWQTDMHTLAIQAFLEACPVYHAADRQHWSAH
jgi:hypothetical protein